MSIESLEPIHNKSAARQTEKAPNYTREEFSELYTYFIANLKRFSDLPEEISDLGTKIRPLIRRTKFNDKEQALIKQYKKLKSEYKRLSQVREILREPKYKSFLLELRKENVATVLVAEPQKQAEEKKEGGVLPVDANALEKNVERNEVTGRYAREWEKIKEKQGVQLPSEGFIDVKIAKKYLELLTEYSRELELEFTKEGRYDRTVRQYMNFVQNQILESFGEYVDCMENTKMTDEDRHRIRHRIRRSFEDFKGRLAATKEMPSNERDYLLSFLKSVIRETVCDDLDKPESSHAIDAILLDLDGNAENVQVREKVRAALEEMSNEKDKEKRGRLADKPPTIIEEYGLRLRRRLQELILDTTKEGIEGREEQRAIVQRREEILKKILASVKQEIAQYNKQKGWKGVREERTRRHSRTLAGALA